MSSLDCACAEAAVTYVHFTSNSHPLTSEQQESIGPAGCWHQICDIDASMPTNQVSVHVFWRGPHCVVLLWQAQHRPSYKPMMFSKSLFRQSKPISAFLQPSGADQPVAHYSSWSWQSAFMSGGLSMTSASCNHCKLSNLREGTFPSGFRAQPHVHLFCLLPIALACREQVSSHSMISVLC